MQNRYPFFWILVLTLLCILACAHPGGPLHLATETGREAITDSDVEEVYLKYDRRDGRYFAVIALNTAGIDKVGRLIAGRQDDRTLQVFMGERRLTEVPVMTDHIDKLVIKFDERQSAVDLLKNLSH